jgi:hypothetical protein
VGVPAVDLDDDALLGPGEVDDVAAVGAVDDRAR